MTKVKILDNSMNPNWQVGIEVEVENEQLNEWLEKGWIKALEPIQKEPIQEEVEVEEPAEVIQPVQKEKKTKKKKK